MEFINELMKAWVIAKHLEFSYIDSAINVYEGYERLIRNLNQDKNLSRKNRKKVSHERFTELINLQKSLDDFIEDDYENLKRLIDKIEPVYDKLNNNFNEISKELIPRVYQSIINNDKRINDEKEKYDFIITVIDNLRVLKLMSHKDNLLKIKEELESLYFDKRFKKYRLT